MNFEEYLQSKKIDSTAFRNSEEKIWESWKLEFEQLHPTSFTAQKLYLINPIRRKYQLKVEIKPKEGVRPAKIEATSVAEPTTEPLGEKQAIPRPAAPRPVFKPKPKIS